MNKLGGNYVSCIKINGKSILPPIITPELQKELLEYKKQAIKLESRLIKCKDINKKLNEFVQNDKEYNRPNSVLTFGDNSHIEALGIPETTTAKKKSNLRMDIIEVTQYDSNGMQTVDSIHPVKDNVDANEMICDTIKSKSYISPAEDPNILIGSDLGTNESQEVTSVSKPRLIRSNSYTLESPSPILLAHLQKEKNNNNNQSSAQSWTNIPYESSDFSSLTTVCLNENFNNDGATPEDSPNKSSKTIELKSPTIEVYQTDISVQQITVNTNVDSCNSNPKGVRKELFISKDPFDVFEPDSNLLNVLKDIPDNYASQIIELLKKQHSEQKERLERYEHFQGSDKLSSSSEVFRSQSTCESNRIVESSSTNVNTSPKKSSFINESPKNQSSNANLIDLTSPINKSLETYYTPGQDNHEIVLPRRNSTFSMSPSQSLYYSVTSDTLTAPNTPSIKLIDLESNESEIEDKNDYWEGIMVHENRKNSNCSKELFPEIDPVTRDVMRREWAASVIGAHAKGYLTRRLLKTEKVQIVIATIKDVLICALDLHRSDNIDEKDVELHRRLINQLSAALYSFHEIFFDISTQEQMLIIAADRHRKREKIKRPLSGRSSVRSLSNSSITPGRSNKSIKSARSGLDQKLVNKSQSATKV